MSDPYRAHRDAAIERDRIERLARENHHPSNTHDDEREVRFTIADLGLPLEPEIWLQPVAIELRGGRHETPERFRELINAAANVARVEGMRGGEPERVIDAALQAAR